MSIFLPSDVMVTFILDNGLSGGLDATGNLVLYDKLENLVHNNYATAFDVAIDVTQNTNVYPELQHSLKATILRYSQDQHLLFWADTRDFHTFIIDSTLKNYDAAGVSIVECDNPGITTGGSLSSTSDIDFFPRHEVILTAAPGAGSEDEGDVTITGGLFQEDYSHVGDANTYVIQQSSRRVGVDTLSNVAADNYPPIHGIDYTAYVARTHGGLSGIKPDQYDKVTGEPTKITASRLIRKEHSNTKYIVYNELKNIEEEVKKNNVIITFSTYADNYFITRISAAGNGTIVSTGRHISTGGQGPSLASGYEIVSDEVNYEKVCLPTHPTFSKYMEEYNTRQFGTAFSFVNLDTGAGIYTISTNEFSDADKTFTKTTNIDGVDISTESLTTKDFGTFTSDDKYAASLPVIIGNRRRSIGSALETSFAAAEAYYTRTSDGVVFTELTTDSIIEATKGAFLVAYGLKHGFLLMYLDATAHMFVPPIYDTGIEYHIPGGKWDTTDNIEITDVGGWTPISMAFSPIDNFLYTIIQHPSDATQRKLCIYNTSIADADAIRDSATMIDNPFSGSLDKVELLPDGNIWIWSIGSTQYMKIHSSDYQDAIDLISAGFTTVESYASVIEFTPIFEPLVSRNEDGSEEIPLRLANTIEDYAVNAVPAADTPLTLGAENNSMTPSFTGAGDNLISIDSVSVDSEEVNTSFSGALTDADKFDRSQSHNNFYTDSNYNKLFTLRQNTVVYRNGESELLPNFSLDKIFIGAETYAFPSYYNPTYVVLGGKMNGDTFELYYNLIKFTPRGNPYHIAPTTLNRGEVIAGGKFLDTIADGESIVAIKIFSPSLFDHRIIVASVESDTIYNIRTYKFDAKPVDFTSTDNISDKVILLDKTPITVTATEDIKTSLIEVSSSGNKIAIILGDENSTLTIADYDLESGSITNPVTEDPWDNSPFYQILFSYNSEVLYGITKTGFGEMSLPPNKYATGSNRMIKIEVSTMNSEEVIPYPLGKQDEIEMNRHLGTEDSGAVPPDFKKDGNVDNIVYDPTVTFGDSYVPQYMFMSQGKIYFTAGIYKENPGVTRSQYLSRITSADNYELSRYALNAIDIGSTAEIDPTINQDTNTAVARHFEVETVSEDVASWVRGPQRGCMDPNACNYDHEATVASLAECMYPDGRCAQLGVGCGKRYGLNQCGECYRGPTESNEALLQGTPSGCFKCCDPTAFNYDSDSEINCAPEIDFNFLETPFDPNVSPCICDNASCTYEGCTDNRAANYDPNADVADDSCIYASGFCVDDGQGGLTLQDPDNYCGDCGDLDNNPIYRKAKVDGITICDCVQGDGIVGTYVSPPTDPDYCDCGTSTKTITNTVTGSGTTQITTSEVSVVIGASAYGGIVARNRNGSLLIVAPHDSDEAIIWGENGVTANTEGQDIGGFTDWRLPTLEELSDIYHHLFYTGEGALYPHLKSINTANFVEWGLYWSNAFYEDGWIDHPLLETIASGAASSPRAVNFYPTKVVTARYNNPSIGPATDANRVRKVRSASAITTTTTAATEFEYNEIQYDYTAPDKKADDDYCDCNNDWNPDLYCGCNGVPPTAGCGCGTTPDYTTYCDCTGTHLKAYYKDFTGDGYGDEGNTRYYFCEDTGIGYTNGSDNGTNLTDQNDAEPENTDLFVLQGPCSESFETDVCDICHGTWVYQTSSGYIYHKDTSTGNVYCSCPTEEYPQGEPMNNAGCCGTDIRDCYGNCVALGSPTLDSYGSTGTMNGPNQCNECGEPYAAYDNCGTCGGDNSDCACPDQGADVIKDCGGTCGGTAFLDSCISDDNPQGVCSGGTTGQVANSSCTGCTDENAQNYDPNALYSDNSCIDYVLTILDEGSIDSSGECSTHTESVHLGYDGYDPTSTPLGNLYNKENISVEHNINGTLVSFDTDNIHFTSKCQIIGKNENENINHLLQINCPFTNAEIIYTLSNDNGISLATNVSAQIDVSHINGAYAYKPRYYFRISEDYEMDTLAVQDIFGDYIHQCTVKKVDGNQSLIETPALEKGAGPVLSDPTHVPPTVDTYAIFIVEPLWDPNSNQYYEFTIDFRNTQDPNICVEDGILVQREICCDNLDISWEEEAECTKCSDSACSGDGIEIPNPVYECIEDPSGTANNLYEGNTFININNVDYNTVLHDESKCEYDDLEIEGLYLYLIIDTTGLKEEDYAKFKWNFTDSNTNILQSYTLPRTPSNLQNINVPQLGGYLTNAIVKKITLNLNTACALFNWIGATSKVWRQSYLYLGRELGILQETHDDLKLLEITRGQLTYSKNWETYQNQPIAIKSNYKSVLLKLTPHGECNFGCDFNSPHEFFSERCTKTTVADAEGFTDFTVEVATSGTSQSYALSEVSVYEIFSGNVLARFTELEENTTYTENIRLVNKTSIGIEVKNNTNNGPIKYKITAEDGTVIINKTT